MKPVRPEVLSDRLCLARRAAGFKTARDAARALGVSPPTYYAHENGTRGIKGETLVAYASGFGVSLEWLLAGEQPSGAVSQRAGALPEGPAAIEKSSPPSPGVGRPPRLHRRRLHSSSGKGAASSGRAAPITANLSITAAACRGAFIDPDYKPKSLGEVTIEISPNSDHGLNPRQHFGHLARQPALQNTGKPPSPDPSHYFALQMVDASMDLHYPQGSVVICRRVSPGSNFDGIRHGDHVAVETHLAGLVETVIAEIQAAGQTQELHFLSSDGRLRRVDDFSPERPLKGTAPSPFTQRRRTIVGVVAANIEVKSVLRREADAQR